MTPNEINLVQQTFAKVVPIAPQAASLFYTKLFELDPNLRPLFKGDIVEQGEKLMKMIGTRCTFFRTTTCGLWGGSIPLRYGR